MIVDPTTARNQKDDSQKPEARPQRSVGAASEDHPEALGCGLDEMPSAVSVVALADGSVRRRVQASAFGGKRPINDNSVPNEWRD